MRKLRKPFMLLLTMILVISSLSACGTKNGANATTASSDVATTDVVATDAATDDAAATDTKPFKIGVCQLVQHDALDASYKGFVDGLAEAGYVDGDNIILDYQNAQGDQSNCSTIATKFVNDNDDLILAIATPAAQACANATKDIPILVTAVTDPADSKIVASNEAPGGNITGTSDLTPVKEQMDLLVQLVPNAKKIAILYNSSETNSKIQAEMAKDAATALGLETQDATVSNTNEVQQVVQSLVGKVDAIYAPTDNMIASSMATVAMIANDNNLPVICGEEGMVTEGGLATYGINYYDLGKQTAAQAVKILKGEAKPADMPIEYQENVKLTINKDVAAKLGITIPAELEAK